MARVAWVSVDAVTATRILIVEDDQELAGLIADYLRQHGFAVEIEERGDRAIDRIRSAPPDLVVLDLMLPGADGLTVCRAVRPTCTAPILMLTACGEESDEVTGLELGADDYLAKPVRPRILLARVRALLRRPSASPRDPAPACVQVGPLRIDPGCRTAELNGTPVDVTSGEFDLLLLLASNAGQVLSRQYMHGQLRGTDFDEFDRSIDLRVSRLRQKLGAISGHHDAILTVRGVGYLYARG